METVQAAPTSSMKYGRENRRQSVTLIGTFVLCAASSAVCAQHKAERDTEAKMVYEIPTRASARPVLRAVEAHLDEGSRTLTIAVVAHGSGVEALLKGAADADGVRYAPAVQRLAHRGVTFAVCNATLKLRGIGHDRVIAEGRIVPRGTGEIARLISIGYQPLN